MMHALWDMNLPFLLLYMYVYCVSLAIAMLICLAIVVDIMLTHMKPCTVLVSDSMCGIDNFFDVKWSNRLVVPTNEG